MKNYLLAIATLIGTIVGVGIFTVPYVINQAGIVWLFVYIIILGVVQNYLHWLYAEIVLSTKTEHRLPGYVEKYFGAKHKKATLFINMISDYGAILAYIIVGGLFSYQLFGQTFGGGQLAYTAVFFSILSLIVLLGIRAIASTELVMTGFLILIIGLIGWRGFDFISLGNYVINDWQNFLLPYGPIFFAVGGSAAIPEVCKLLQNDKQKIKSAISWGTSIAAFITLSFVFLVVGITGEQTTKDTLSGLRLVFNDGVIMFALVFGLLAVATSFLIISQSLREVFWWDFKINKHISWALACIVPFLFFLFGFRDLTKIVSLTGSICGGVIGIILLWLIFGVKARPEQVSALNNKANKKLSLAMSLLFLAGLVYEFWEVLK